MNYQELQIIVYVIAATMLATGPWMLMLHTKLAVLSKQAKRTEEKVQRVLTLVQKLKTTPNLKEFDP
ncbi:MAG: hypothetical protein JXB10_09050 [Pirellulales bacterium]|nr:hypothetical protein [Pirellulales bacterium]